MGLSVISTIAAPVSTMAPSLASETTGAQSGGFAALLFGQTLAGLLAPAAGTPDLPGTANLAGEEKNSGEALMTDTATNSIDPAAVVALLGNPQIQPAITPRAAIGQEQLPADESRERGAGLANPLLGAASRSDPQREPAPGTSLTALGERPAGAPLAPTDQPQGADLVQRADQAQRADAANIAAPGEQSNQATAFQANLSAVLQTRESAINQPTTVAIPLHNQAWPQQFGEKLVWIAKTDQQTAQINLNPPQLGPVQITLNLSGDQATAVFASPHAEVRQAIESSLPQLRDMLSTAGITLGDADVGANLAQQNQGNAFQPPNRAQSTLENAILPTNDNAPVAGIATPLHHGRGLVDLFA